EHHVDRLLRGRLGNRLLGRVVGSLDELLLDLLVANVLRDVERALVRRLRDRLLPAPADLGLGHEPHLLERGREDAEVAVRERRQARDHDGRRKADVLRKATDDVLVRELLRDDRLADLDLGETVETLTLLQLEARETDSPVAAPRLLLLPAE